MPSAQAYYELDGLHGGDLISRSKISYENIRLLKGKIFWVTINRL